MAMTRNPTDDALGHLSRDQRMLLREVTQTPPEAVWLTGTRVDTGGWMGRRRIVAAAMADRLILLAAGAKPFVESIAFQKLQESLYNHVTGELVLAPATGASLRALDLPSLDAQRLLDMIRTQESV